MEKHSWILKNLEGGIGLFPLFFCAIIEKARNVLSQLQTGANGRPSFGENGRRSFCVFLVKTAEINGKFIFAKGFALVRVPVLCYNFMVFGTEKERFGCFSVKFCKEREIRFDST